MNKFKRCLAMFLALCMMFSVAPFAVSAAGTEGTESAEPAEQSFETESYAAEAEEFLRVFHLDCGRKFFEVDQVKELIDAISAKGYSHMELAIGNDGLRLLLDDMSVTANGTTYASETVKSGIKSGNASYSHSGEWSEDEMDTIIAYAKTKGIEIIPLVNTPGHMDSILAAMKACGIDGYYESSARTVDLENETAVAFTQALVEKYVDYFAPKGCKYFNIGADEYANDYHTDANSGMGFGYLVKNNMYGNFVNYVNTLSEYIVGKGMSPIAFNDGIYYNETTSQGTFNTNLIVAAWTGGWGGIKPASTSFLQSKGHQILNTNERWYYVLGRTQSSNSTYCYESALSNAKSESVTTVTDHASGVTSMGAMQCVWCDEPSADYASNKSNVLTLINTLADNNTDYFTGPNETVDPEPSEPETPETVTRTDEETNVSVSAPGLTGLTVAEVKENVPAIEGAEAVVVYDVVPMAGETAYTGEATVTLPVPADWTNVRGGVLASEHGEEVLGIEGQLKDGVFTFDVPHFSNVVTYEVAAAAEEQDVTIELEVGDTHEIVVEGKDLSGTYNPDPAGVANVNVKYEQVEGETTVTLGNQITPTNSSGWSDTGVIKCGNYYLVMSSTGALSATTKVEEATVFTVTRSGSSQYTIKSGNYYLRYNNSVSGSTTSYAWRYSSTNGFYRQESNWFVGSTTNYYLTYSNGWTTSTRASNGTHLYDVTTPTTEPKDESTITFTAVAPGETTVTIDGTTYKIVVNKKQYTAKITVGANQTFDDTSAAVTVADGTVASAALKDGKLVITGLKEGTTTVTTDNAVYTVNVITFDPSTVEPLVIEHWITNHPVNPDDEEGALEEHETYKDSDGDTASTIQKIWIEVPADLAYTEAGVDLSELVVFSGLDNDMGNVVVFWKGTALDVNEHQQTTAANDNESYNGEDFTKVRYWNGAWQVLTADGWTNVTEDMQVVAYYLQKTQVTNQNVIQTEVVDWGEVYGESTYGDANFVALDFAIKYEDGTRDPDSFAVSGKTLMFHCDYNNALNQTVFRDGSYYYRRISTIHARETSNYEVYMITLTPNSDTKSTEVASKASGIRTINYNGTEKVVWVDDEANLGQFADADLQHADFTIGGSPTVQKVDIYNQQAMLVTYYVRAKQTDDSLTVVYVDEKFNDILYTYNIAVKAGVNFNENIDPEPAKFTGNANRIDVNGTGITNLTGVYQTFQTDLTKVPEAVGKYNSELYEYTGSEISADGKTLYLYYNINTSILSPIYVADFGLPIKFPLSDVVKSGIDTVASVTVAPNTRYGTLSYDSANKEFTYTPTQILKGIDVLSIRVAFDGETGTTTTNVGVTPATTIYYEESFVDWDDNWTGGSEAVRVGTQTKEILGEKVNNYGYDPIYADTSAASNGTVATGSTIGAIGTFTFTGDGIQVFATGEAKEEGHANWVSVQVLKDDENGKPTIPVSMAMVDTAVQAGVTDATSGQNEDLYGLPVVSLVDLQNIPHGTYTVNIVKVMTADPVHIDGIRVFNTINKTNTSESEDNKKVFTADLEDEPSYYELRDSVLNAIGIKDDTSADYKTMFTQVYNAANGAAALITSESVAYGNSSNIQDLLDNGPKNELYLYKDQTLTFKVTTDRVLQLGLKAPNGAANVAVTVNGTATDLTKVESSVDMFYTLVGAPAKNETEYTVSVKNSSENILAVTLLKVCDDPEFAFAALNENDIKAILADAGYTETPEEPTEPEEPVVPDVPEEPEIVYADAALTVKVVDYKGKVLGTAQLTANGEQGETKVFTAAEILDQAAQLMPKKYDFADKKAVEDVSVVYGEEGTVSVLVGKVAKLKITYVNLIGRKQGTAEITAVQTGNGYLRASASEIAALAPAGRHAIWFSSAVVMYGSTASIVVPVI